MSGRNSQQKRAFNRVHQDDAGYVPKDRNTAKADQFRIGLAINTLARTNADEAKILAEAERLGITPASSLVAAVKRIRAALSNEE